MPREAALTYQAREFMESQVLNNSTTSTSTLWSYTTPLCITKLVGNC